TRLVALTHAGNVLGTLQPIREVGRLARERDLLFLVDAAQTAGVVPLDVEAHWVDLLAFPGHRGPLGPTAAGALYVGARAPAGGPAPSASAACCSRPRRSAASSTRPSTSPSGPACTAPPTSTARSAPTPREPSASAPALSAPRPTSTASCKPRARSLPDVRHN